MSQTSNACLHVRANHVLSTSAHLKRDVHCLHDVFAYIPCIACIACIDFHHIHRLLGCTACFAYILCMTCIVCIICIACIVCIACVACIVFRGLPGRRSRVPGATKGGPQGRRRRRQRRQTSCRSRPLVRRHGATASQLGTPTRLCKNAFVLDFLAASCAASALVPAKRQPSHSKSQQPKPCHAHRMHKDGNCLLPTT